VYVVLALHDILGTLIYVVADRAYSQDVAGYVSLILPGILPTAVGSSLPFAIGVFLAFWQLAPIAPQLRMAHVVTRALLAAVVGAVLSGLVTWVADAVQRLTGVSAGQYTVGRALLDAAQNTLPDALTLLLNGLIVVPLAALLLWGWLVAHPPKRQVGGALDEV
jgi:hypothetical protein